MLLSIDTSTRAVGVALYDGVRVLNETIWLSKNYHTVELAPAVAETLSRAGVEAGDLQAVGVALGPGSFTGLRIGLALAKGLAFSRRLPLIGIPTLDVLAASQPVRDVPLAAVLEAGRKRLAVGWYHPEDGRWQSTGKLENLTLDEFVASISEPTLVCGELKAEARRHLKHKHENMILASPAQSVRRPAFLAELAWARWQAGKTDDPATLAPIYLHHGEPIPG